MTDFYNPFFPSSHQEDTRGRRPEVSEILPALFVGEYPRVEDIQWLKQQFCISAVLSLQDADDIAVKSISLPALMTEYRHYHIEFRRLPIADFDCRSLAKALPSALQELHTLIQNNHTVLLHCNAGCNRAPTGAIDYLHSHHNMTLDAARDFVKAKRPCGPYMEVLYQYFARPSIDQGW
jgi:atypical dual specificity phosphatase